MLRPRFNISGLHSSAAAAAAATGAGKIASTYDLVEPMWFLYVHVVKARDLPVTATGAIDPFVEVNLGNFKGTTTLKAASHNPSWQQVFAYSAAHLQSHLLEVALNAKDLGGDDLVGRVVFDLSEVPVRVPPDSPLAPPWYRLEGKRGDKLPHREIMLSVWLGTQADEAFPDAWHSDVHAAAGPAAVASTRAKVYFSPKLIY